jgi:phosphoglucosamine mutase
VGLRFGTDGIRGAANAELSPELTMALGRAAARVLSASTFAVGRDTRRSGPLLQAALTAGLAAEGADVVDLGVLPTPAVAWVGSRRQIPAAMVSASHNPYADNGIKIFAAGGLKLPDAVERSIEDELAAVLAGAPRFGRSPTGLGVGRVTAEPEEAAGYLDHLMGALDGRDLSGLHVVLDCAHGAASVVGPAVFERLGARVTRLACQPDGTNINDGCGSTHPEHMAAAVVTEGADLGLAVDGDADRLLAVDHTGALATGDELLALFAVDLRSRGRLRGETLVVTVMSNLGLRLAMAEQGITVIETPVGDRYVLEVLERDRLGLGGEQSGHLVFRDLATTGDGLLTGLLLADLVRRSGRPLADLAAGAMRRLPQVLVNVSAPDPGSTVMADDVVAAVERVQTDLGARGRVLLRASGTEPVVRVMVEADDHDAARRAVDELCASVELAVRSSAQGLASP